MDDDDRRVARQRDTAAAFDRWTKPRAEQEPSPPVPAESIATFERRMRALWERDRRERISRGACPACGERLCPRVGGRDRECVVG